MHSFLKVREMMMTQSGKHFDPEVVQAFLRREQDFVRIRNLFPDTLPSEDRPFVLPARDRSEPETRQQPAVRARGSGAPLQR